jgi:hypothetical protein
MSVEEGKELKEVGMAIAVNNVPVSYAVQFYAEVENLPKGRLFVSEDITDVVGKPNPTAMCRNNAIGGLMNGIAKRKLARKTGKRIPARNKSSHAAELEVWERL